MSTFLLPKVIKGDLQYFSLKNDMVNLQSYFILQALTQCAHFTKSSMTNEARQRWSRKDKMYKTENQFISAENRLVREDRIYYKFNPTIQLKSEE